MRLHFDWSGLRCSMAYKLLDSGQHFASMPKQNADLLEVLLRQVTEDRDINSILVKALGVLRKAKFLEPVRNLLHRPPRALFTATGRS